MSVSILTCCIQSYVMYLELGLMIFGQSLEILAIVIIQKLNIAGSINLFTLNSMQG